MPASPLNDQGNTALWRPLLLRGLEEDGWLQDWTTLGSVPADAGEASARWVAKAPGVWCASGLQAAIALVSPAELGGAVTATSLVADGQSAVVGQDLARWKGPARLLLALERPALNLAQYTCGIASATARLVAQVEKAARAAGCAAPRVAPTRKTLPHYRDLALFAVRAGGGHPHRVNLAGGVLIKENHVAAAGGMARAVEGARRAAPHGLKIEAEVRNRQELDEALAAGADGVLLDNFAPKQAIEAARAAKKKNSRVLVEISGGVSEETAGSYVDAAVDVISSGSLTHSPKALDISMLLELGK